MDSAAEWLYAEAAARYLHLHPNTIYRMVREEKLPAVRFPVRIRRQDLDSVLERCRIKPGELFDLNQYASGVQLTGAAAITRRGIPDRRYGPRLVRGKSQRRSEQGSASVGPP